MWQTDFTYFRIINWSWYYPSTVLDDFSRNIIPWKLSPIMGATDVTQTPDQALASSGVDQVKVKHRQRLSSDNGSAYLSGEPRDYLGKWRMAHTRGAPCHRQTRGNIERYHRTMKNVVYDNNERYHEAIDNVTPADVYFGRQYEVLTERSKIKRRTMERRKKEYLAQKAA